ncbi:hypothetical protein BX600DRAFT_478196 [Xylariales sp. PMI_506]|nr:hypothetical protein BX600DRAFT_478196 [Xylariales sp. PMI_506]
MMAHLIACTLSFLNAHVGVSLRGRRPSHTSLNRKIHNTPGVWQSGLPRQLGSKRNFHMREWSRSDLSAGINR